MMADAAVPPSEPRVRRILPGTDEWPNRLGELGGIRPPSELFVTGQPLEPRAPCLAVVGTRRPTAAGIDIARRLACGFAEAGITVVSGMAVGIDSAAHSSTLDAGGMTVAVLGCGLDVDYPQRNRALRERIVAAGTLVSEYPAGTPPNRYNFPERNRIIAGMVMGVVVVEGAVTSGALVTARLAVDANRSVYAVPGSIRNPMAAGPNELIRTSEALLVRSVDDVFEDIAPELLATVRSSGPSSDAPRVDAAEADVLRTLDDTPVGVDEIARATGLAPGRIAVVLAAVELRGLAARSRAGFCITRAGARALAAPQEPATPHAPPRRARGRASTPDGAPA
jgi:DNA processing protein